MEQKWRCLKAISRAEGLDMQRRFVLVRVVDTYLELDEEEAKRFSAIIENDTEVHEMVVTWEEALAASKDEGRVEGRDEGRVEGRVEAARTAIVRLAKSLHREVPADFEEKIRAIDDLDRLYEILEQIPKVRSLEDLSLD